MSDLVKRLRDVNGGWASDIALEAADRLEYLENRDRRADLCASGQVRALEWEEYSPGCFFGRSEFGDYAIAPSASVYHDGEIRISGLDGGFTYASSLEAAKAAAQADFERRIRAALTPTPQPAGEAVPLPVGWSSEMDAHPPQTCVSVAEAALKEARANMQHIKERLVGEWPRNGTLELIETHQRKIDAALRALKGGA